MAQTSQREEKRIVGNGELLAAITVHNYRLFVEYGERIRELAGALPLTVQAGKRLGIDGLERLFDAVWKQEYAGVSVICFAAFTAEALIYEYAVNRLDSKSFVEKYLDKLDLSSKYVVILRLATSTPFPTDGQAFERLKALKQDRDGFVHTKVRYRTFGIGDVPSNFEQGVEFENSVHNAVCCLRDLASLIGELDPDMSWLPHVYFAEGRGLLDTTKPASIYDVDAIANLRKVADQRLEKDAQK